MQARRRRSWTAIPPEQQLSTIGKNMLQSLLRNSVRELVGTSGPPTRFLVPAGDPGLFGPDSLPWEIHADFISMMIGGISSLILQALHPGALAGIWDHSSFREDLKGRLGRTAFFIAATTYGSTEMANNAIERVLQIHQKVTGIDEFNRPYSASDPHLLAWVHLTETSSFMRAYLSYKNPLLSQHQQDQYFSQMTLIGNRLGAKDLPHSRTETERLIEGYFAELHYGQRAKSVIALLENFPSKPAQKPFVDLLVKAGFMNLPEWVFPKINRKPPSKFENIAIHCAVALVAKPLRMALKNGVRSHALRRVHGQ
ncbi:MAG: hypothetical protein JWQ10_1140 [Herbaspirillum sp.]|nr:hypothetical protein [Herbaspirillum sp.]